MKEFRGLFWKFFVVFPSIVLDYEITIKTCVCVCLFFGLVWFS